VGGFLSPSLAFCFLGLFDFLLTLHHRTRALESRIAELETEASRLLRALESQKTAFEDGTVRMKRKLAEAAKDLASKVCPHLLIPLTTVFISPFTVVGDRGSEESAEDVCGLR
jgi:hypothetical protein